jgi:hypothetical protein
MAGIGPAPKDPDRRARRNVGPTPLRTVVTERVEQPALSDILGDVNPITMDPWLPATLRLWDELKEFPSTDMLRLAQWSLLARAMMLDDMLVSGDPKYASEARLQFQKFGIAPDDVARLRIVFAQADEMDSKAKPDGSDARARRANMRNVAISGVTD